MIRRNGITLFELLLALTLISILAALTLPPFAMLLSDRRLTRSADQLRIQIAQTRLDAMRGGRVLTLSGTIGGSTLQVAPYFSPADSVEASDPAAAPSALLSGAEQAAITPTTTPDATEATRTIELPETIVLAGVSAMASARTSTLVKDSAGMTSDSGEIQVGQAIFFYPDGSMSDGVIRMANQDGEQTAIAIRGVTGATTVIEGLVGELPRSEVTPGEVTTP
ncbi:MAG: prepilin-type N-terminal cleavage/methylation domain-containing protein [Planctomycetota bacterium]